ncbi:MAG: DUF3467 domain-containing protein [Elusimicrobia bacterium]|jgi:hypothetical protein|nr:DUF3467 domain-containing protein [Elusimicrobiota bacterium]
MNPKKFKKGKHTYVDWGKGVKEVKKMTAKPDNKKQVEIKMDEETAMGKYSNVCSLSHTPEEFVMDYIFIPPKSPQAKVVSRILMSPGHAKRLQMALSDNIKKYEKKFGKISPSEKMDKRIGF